VFNRTSTILNVVFSSVDFSPLNEANDNSVIASLNIGVRVVLGVEED